MDKKIELKVIFTGYSPRLDNTFGLKFASQELTEEELIAINRMKGGFGTLTFTPKEQP